MPDALQGQRTAPAQDPSGALQGPQLARVRQGTPAARQPHSLGDAGGARGLAPAPEDWSEGPAPRSYSDVAIETGHLLRLAFGRPWRQTEGLLHSLTTL